MSKTPNSKRYLTPREAVAEGYFGSEKAAANFRSQRRGPPFYRTPSGRGGRIVYDRQELEKWLLKGRILTAESLDPCKD